VLAFMDIEASGLGTGSWPVEIGWALPFGPKRNGAVLIRPVPEWTHWSSVAETHFHKISRQTLDREGMAPGEALARVEEALYGCEIYVEDPAEDCSGSAGWSPQPDARRLCGCTTRTDCSRRRR
jgi:hypothetical protein